MTVDLHLHTNHSDGTWRPRDLVEYAVKLKMRHIAITDHDTVSGIQEGLETARGRLEIIPGVEINTNAESGQKQKQDIHILGYFIDPGDCQLNDLLAQQRQARVGHVQKVIERLNQAGIAVSMASVLALTNGGPIGKAHITKAIVAAGGAADIKEAYEKFMSKSSDFYVARASVSPRAAIEAINHAGGIAALAHPGKGDQAFATLNELIPYGLRAVEVYHRIHSVQTVQKLIRFANKHGLLITGGSDCHGPYEECAPSLGSISVPLEVVTKLSQAAQLSLPAH